MLRAGSSDAFLYACAKSWRMQLTSGPVFRCSIILSTTLKKTASVRTHARGHTLNPWIASLRFSGWLFAGAIKDAFPLRKHLVTLPDGKTLAQ